MVFFGSLNIIVDAVIGSKVPSTIADCGLSCFVDFDEELRKWGMVDGDNLFVSFGGKMGIM